MAYSTINQQERQHQAESQKVFSEFHSKKPFFPSPILILVASSPSHVPSFVFLTRDLLFVQLRMDQHL